MTGFIQELRQLDLYKVPGIAETLDWMAALVALDQQALEEEVIQDTLGVFLKYQDDVNRVNGQTTTQLLDRVKTKEPTN